MSNDLKRKYEQAHRKLEQLSDYFDDAIDHLEDDAEALTENTQDLWARTRHYLQQLKQKLEHTSNHLASNTDEALLQARLAEMEANAFWDKLSHILELWTRSFEHKSAPHLDRALLHLKLAEMDAHDFIAETKTSLNQHSASLKTQAKALSHKTADNVKHIGDELLQRLKSN